MATDPAQRQQQVDRTLDFLRKQAELEPDADNVPRAAAILRAGDDDPLVTQVYGIPSEVRDGP